MKSILFFNDKVKQQITQIYDISNIFEFSLSIIMIFDLMTFALLGIRLDDN